MNLSNRIRNVAVFVLTLALLASCGGRATKHLDTALSTAIAATNAARDSFTAWDADHQQQIVARSTTREIATADLRAYRTKREPILKGFVLAYQALASAAAIMPLVERGEKKSAEFDAYLMEALHAILVIKEAIKDLS
jgi:hypothetical protein